MSEKREYTAEFKQKAVELSYARGNAAEVCRELDSNQWPSGYEPDDYPFLANILLGSLAINLNDVIL